MLIEVRTDGNFQGSEQFSDQVKIFVLEALERFADRIRRVDVHLSDEVGDKPGHGNQCCMIEVRRNEREPIVVTHCDPTVGQAIHGAVHSLKRSIESAFGRESASAHRPLHRPGGDPVDGPL